MPLNSKIIGVDLCSIKPIPNVKTFVEDITTQNCYAAIKKELRNEEVVLLLLQVDAVLHDGAPNVGQDWTHDAFTQVIVKYELEHIGIACTKNGNQNTKERWDIFNEGLSFM